MRYVLVIGEPWNYRHSPMDWEMVLRLVKHTRRLQKQFGHHHKLWVEAA